MLHEGLEVMDERNNIYILFINNPGIQVAIEVEARLLHAGQSVECVEVGGTTQWQFTTNTKITGDSIFISKLQYTLC